MWPSRPRHAAGGRHSSARLLLIVPLLLLAIGVIVAQKGGPPSVTPRSPGQVETLTSAGGLSPAIVGLFREPLGFQQAGSGEYFVFDRRGHSVHVVDAAGASRKLVQIGGEEGRVLEPSAFGLAPNGTFAVADAPRGQERIQIFDGAGNRLSGFTLPGRATTRISVGGLTLNGVGTLAFTGRSILLNHPETGSLVTEYTLSGIPIRSLGPIRATGHEEDRELHLAMNAAIPLVDPAGGFWVVFLAGTPAFRKYDRAGALAFERILQGRELDPILAQMPQRWPRRTVDGTEVPLVVPLVRAAALDPSGHLWISFVATPTTYVFDREGEKIRTVQFRAAGIISPTSLAFTTRGRVLVTPGCYEFATR